PYFYHGITNGADWYMIWGGMQDWNYHHMGNNEVTLELSDTHDIPASQIPIYWDDNRQSMLAYIETCLIGVRGLVTDEARGQPLAATVSVPRPALGRNGFGRRARPRGLHRSRHGRLPPDAPARHVRLCR
ncbi:MAG: M14 family zinc carboxypeptidase, partial [Planctomycetota bacterium]